MATAIEPILFNVRDASRFLNIHRTTFSKLQKKADFPRPIVLCQAKMWRREDLEAWVKSLQSSESSAA